MVFLNDSSVYFVSAVNGNEATMLFIIDTFHLRAMTSTRETSTPPNLITLQVTRSQCGLIRLCNFENESCAWFQTL